MIIILGLAFICVASILGYFIGEKANYDMGGLGFTAFISGLILLIVLIILPISQADIKAKIAGFEASRLTLISARENKSISPLELAAIQSKAIENNDWLAQTQYWRQNPITNWFIPKKILEIKPIR